MCEYLQFWNTQLLAEEVNERGSICGQSRKIQITNEQHNQVSKGWHGAVNGKV